ncbi:MAG: hypothetical protein ACM3WP_10855 [Acidobacteriota bacterium]
MNFVVLDARIDALAEQLASARERDDAHRLADELAHVIWLKEEMARRFAEVGALAHA